MPRAPLSPRAVLPTLGALAAVSALAALAPPAAATAAAPPELPGVAKIDGDPVRTLLPPDAIPALEGGSFVPADEAGFLRDDEPVVGVVRNGVAKAYSLWQLDRHEIVNDVFADEPLAVTW